MGQATQMTVEMLPCSHVPSQQPHCQVQTRITYHTWHLYAGHKREQLLCLLTATHLPEMQYDSHTSSTFPVQQLHVLHESSITATRLPKSCITAAYLPEVQYDRMLWVVTPSIVDVSLHVCNVHPLPSTTDQHLDLLFIEHGDPVVSHQLKEAPPEGFTARLDLVVQPVVRHSVNVLYHVLACHSFAAASRH